MSTEEYKVHKVLIDEIEFEALIMELPGDKNELEDALAYFAREKGNITKSLYEDFVLVTCVANIHQMVHHINKRQAVDMSNVREQTIGYIFKYNPLLDPDNIIINKNFVLKIKAKEDMTEEDKPIKSNKFWDTPYYDEGLDKKNSFMDKVSNPQEVTKEELKETPKNNQNIVKSVDNLDYIVVEKWWNRIRTYISVKKFSEEDAISILSNKFFHNRSSFQTYIVSVCVVDANDLFTLLDTMGIPNHVAPPILMKEVYEFCNSVNPFLTFEKAQELAGTLVEEPDTEEDKCSKVPPNRMRSHVNQEKSKKKKLKRKFKDVPKEDLLRLSDAMKVFVIGQDHAIDNIVSSIQRASVGLKDPVKPIGSFLFAGRTGCGKTKTCKVLADELIRDRENLVTIDCSEYSSDHEYSKLIGSPAGYVGHEQGGILTNAIMENPFSIIVFDEVEKASTKVHELMLQILDEGRLTDNKGQHVSFKDTVVIMTSNIGVSEVENVKKTVGFGDVAKLTEERKIKSIDEAIKKKFKPEFINRIDSIVHFNSLTEKDYMRIIDIELEKLNENLRNNDTEYKGLSIEFDKKVRDVIFKDGINEDFGARPLKRCIEKTISDKLAETLLKKKVAPDSIVRVGVKDDEISFSFKRVKKDKEFNATAANALR